MSLRRCTNQLYKFMSFNRASFGGAEAPQVRDDQALRGLRKLHCDQSSGPLKNDHCGRASSLSANRDSNNKQLHACKETVWQLKLITIVKFVYHPGA